CGSCNKIHHLQSRLSYPGAGLWYKVASPFIRSKRMTIRVPHLINGQWRHDAGSAPFAVTDPTSNQPLWEVASASADEINEAVASAKRAFQAWREVPTPERARLMLRYQHLLKQH